MIKKLTGLRAIKINLTDDKKQARLLFQFDENTQQSALEIEMAAGDLMAVMVALQKLQRRHQIPIPANRPKGPPSLSIVSD
jgi:hypothetical protein